MTTKAPVAVDAKTWTIGLGDRAIFVNMVISVELHDDYFEHQRNKAEDMAWQYHESACTDDQLFAEAARETMEDAKKGQRIWR